MNESEPSAMLDLLITRAKQAATQSYSPYSNFKVGAAAVFVNVGGGYNLASGCNIENASYGVTLCAECSLISDMFRQSKKPLLLKIVTCDPDGNYLSPCGRCRQLLAEFSDHETTFWVGGTDFVTLSQLLPGAFKL